MRDGLETDLLGSLELGELSSSVHAYSGSEDLDLIRVHRCVESTVGDGVRQQLSSRRVGRRGGRTGVRDHDLSVLDSLGRVDGDVLLKNEACKGESGIVRA